MELIDRRSPSPYTIYLNSDATDDDIKQLPRLPYASSIRELRMGGSRQTDRSLEHVAQLPQLERLWISQAAITDDGLEAIGTISSLTELRFIWSSKVRGHGLAHLAKLQSLVGLCVEGCEPYLEGGLHGLAVLKSLRRLGLGYNSLIEGSLAGIGSLTQIEELHLNNCKANDRVRYDELNRLVNLRSLELHASQVVPGLLPHIAGLTKLEQLTLSLTKHSDHDLIFLAGLQNLRELVLGVSPDRSDALLMLLGLTKLKRLYVPGWSISREVAEALKAAAPQLEIEFLTMSYMP